MNRLVQSLQLPPSLQSQFTNLSRWQFILLLGLLILGVSCAPIEKTEPNSQWDYATLKWISSYNENIASGDFVAGYIRSAGSDLQLRFDLLDVGIYPKSDFFVALDTQPGGTYQLPIQGDAEIEWDTLLVLPASGSPKAYSASEFIEMETFPGTEEQLQLRQDIIPRISRFPWHDYILVSINRNALPDFSTGLKIQAFSTDPQSKTIKDSLGPYRSDDFPPQPAPLLLAFWNTFPAYSPAQSLRRWDGAHTGPFGERHGLSILLENIERFKVPVVLLDLRNPFVFSALDYLNQMTLIRELISRKLVILPDSLPGSPSYPVFPKGLPDWAIGQYLQELQATSEEFEIPSSNILYLPHQISESPGNYSLLFSPNPQRRSSGFNLFLPVPEQIPDEIQASPDGLPLTIRKRLIDHVLQINNTRESYPLLVLGGSLPDSAFADPASAAATLGYIANHPWINTVTETDLLSLPDNTNPMVLSGKTNSIRTDDFSPSEILATLPNPSANDKNPLYKSIWVSALSLFAPLPPESETLPSLRTNYSGQPGITQAAASWSDDPLIRSDCQTDPDGDGVPECILASDNQLAIFDLEGGRLVAYYTIDRSGIHQIIGSSSQFIVGIGDPSSWLLDAGEGSEPSGIHGAFIDSSPPWDYYSVSSSGELLTFTSPDRSIIKTFSLSNEKLQVNYSSSVPISVKIPIAIDPWRRFSPYWQEAFTCQPINGGYACDITEMSTVDILSTSPLSASSFKDSYISLNEPEDPNLNYPPGHYLPFPLVLIETIKSNSFSIQIKPFQ
ncbi:MAG: hypothetical protein ACWGN2_03705 [Anaerolineales bacterium]